MNLHNHQFIGFSASFRFDSENDPIEVGHQLSSSTGLLHKIRGMGFDQDVSLIILIRF